MPAPLVVLLKSFLINRIRKGVTRLMFKKLAKRVLESKTLKGKLTLASALPLIIGSVAGAFGYDLAPTTVDLIVTFVSSVGVAIGYGRAVYQAVREELEEGK